MWLNDGTAGTGWQHQASVATQYPSGGGTCGPGVVPPGADVELTDGHLIDVVVTMPSQCEADDPDDGACIVWGPVVLRGDVHAPARVLMP